MSHKSIRIILITVLFLFVLSFSISFAKDNNDNYLQVNIPGGASINLEKIKCVNGKCSLGWISQYISDIYRYGVGLAAILAVIMIMAGGFIWLMSAGSPDKVGKAKEFITSALTGLLLALFSFIILQTINPRLVVLDGSFDAYKGEYTPLSHEWNEKIAPQDGAAIGNLVLENLVSDSGLDLEVRNFNFQETDAAGDLLEGGTFFTFEIPATPEFRRFLQENAETRTSIPLPLVPGFLEPDSTRAFFYYRGVVITPETSDIDGSPVYRVLGNPLISFVNN